MADDETPRLARPGTVLRGKDLKPLLAGIAEAVKAYIEPLRARIAALEARPTVKPAGTFDPIVLTMKARWSRTTAPCGMPTKQ